MLLFLFAIGEAHDLKGKDLGFARMVKIEHRRVTKVWASTMSAVFPKAGLSSARLAEA